MLGTKYMYVCVCMDFSARVDHLWNKKVTEAIGDKCIHV